MIEIDFYRRLKELGFSLYNTGWPDFVIKAPNGQILLIEHKNLRNKLKSNQLEMHTLLQEAGVTVYVVHSIEEVVELSGMNELKPKLVKEDLKESHISKDTNEPASETTWEDKLSKELGFRPSDYLPENKDRIQLKEMN